ncbi:MAG TPA: SAM-dependent chlorinase/fluorinase [Terriglobia bacterium]|nr:SAM-dependent chlorinase/fluorinase [Terriglobia bacterium]
MPSKPVITMTTDFGEQDHFVGVMKAVILKINPEAVIVDINHQVNSYDVFDGAFTLAQSYLYFPPETIHLVVVDPGVGSSRRPILVRTAHYNFVAPDNGVLSLIYEREERVEVRHVTANHYFLNPVSNTFHGRDIFAPVAAWLSRGVEAEKFGEVITDYAKSAFPRPKWENPNLLKGMAIKVDKFGNIITNLRPEDVPQLFAENPPRFRIVVSGREVTEIHASFALGKPSEIFAILGSSGFLELATNRGSAAKALNAKRGTEVAVMLGEEPAPAP